MNRGVSSFHSTFGKQRVNGEIEDRAKEVCLRRVQWNHFKGLYKFAIGGFTICA